MYPPPRSLYELRPISRRKICANSRNAAKIFRRRVVLGKARFLSTASRIINDFIIQIRRNFRKSSLNANVDVCRVKPGIAVLENAFCIRVIENLFATFEFDPVSQRIFRRFRSYIIDIIEISNVVIQNSIRVHFAPEKRIDTSYRFNFERVIYKYDKYAYVEIII